MKISQRKFVCIFVVIALVISIMTGHRIFIKKYLPNTKIANYSSVIETNSFVFNTESYGVENREISLVSAAYELKDQIWFFSAKRDGSIIKMFKYFNNSIDNNLSEPSELNLNSITPFKGLDQSKTFIFDLFIDTDKLLVSFVRTPQYEGSYDTYYVISFDIKENILSPESVSIIFEFTPEISSYPNNPGWHDFSGKLSSDTRKVYLACGLIIAATAIGRYPNQNLSGLGSDLNKEISKHKFFGSVISIDKKTGKHNRFAWGFRGPSGLAVQETKLGNKLWLLDHGPRGGDELNLLEEGENYGWPAVSYGQPYGNSSPEVSLGTEVKTDFGTHVGYSEPVYSWSPSIAPSNILVLSTDIDQLGSFAKNDLLIGSLKGQSLYRIKMDGDRVKTIEQIPLNTRVRDLTQIGKKIIVSTDDGRILVLTLSQKKLATGLFPPMFQAVQFYEKIPVLRSLIDVIEKTLFKLKSLFD
jgi:hypothetical protein